MSRIKDAPDCKQTALLTATYTIFCFPKIKFALDDDDKQADKHFRFVTAVLSIFVFRRKQLIYL